MTVYWIRASAKFGVNCVFYFRNEPTPEDIDRAFDEMRKLCHEVSVRELKVMEN